MHGSIEPFREKRKNDESSSSTSLFLTPSDEAKLNTKGYRLYKKLTKGSLSKLYLAYYNDKNKEEMLVACKVMSKTNVDRKFIEKFLPREVAILKEISNPHCIQTFHIIEIRNKCFIFMKYAENGDLLEYLTRNGPPRESKTRLWIRQLMFALKYLQQRQICHRDIKCENIFITANSNVKLGDFGFARHWSHPVTDQEMLSETYCGSVSYAAPEILMGKPYSPKYCDIWSMGVVFFVMVNMAKPFTKDKASSLLQQQLAKDYQFRARSAKYISDLGKDVIRKMLEPNIHLRMTIQEVIDCQWMRKDELLLQRLPDM